MAGKIIKIREDVLDIKFVNCDGYKNTFYKYMNFKRVVQLLETKCLTFVLPSKWNDPYESRFLETDFSEICDYHQPPIFCTCLRNDNENEEASWNIYKDPKDYLLRLSFNANKLLLALKDFAQKNHYKVYFAKVDYRLQRNEIDTLHESFSKYFHQYFDNFDEEKYIRLMSIKRRAFKYEHERRIFFVPQKGCNVPQDGLLHVPIDVNSIVRFTLYPIGTHDDVKKYDSIKKAVRAKLKSLNKNIKLYRSTLYDKAGRVDKIQKAE